MEALLSLSFDNIASRDPSKVRKGLRCIEGLLQQVCCPSMKARPSTPSHRRNASAISLTDDAPPKKLRELPEDPAFMEFFKLQEGFEWNVAIRVADCLERLMSVPNAREVDELIRLALSNLHGLLLLHPPSRAIFSREVYMNMLLDLLDTYNCPAIQTNTVFVLASALLGNPQNIRTFEHMDGLPTVTALYENEETDRKVKTKLLELLYFYQLPEEPVAPAKSSGASGRRTPTPYREDSGAALKRGIRSQQEKQYMMGQYMDHVEAKMEILDESLCGPVSFAVAAY